MIKTMAMMALGLMICAAPARAEQSGAHDHAKTAAVLGQAAPDFTLGGADGKEHKLSDYKDKIVVLEWTNHECPYVKKHYGAGNMQALQKDAQDKGVVWLTINSSAAGQQGHVTADQAQTIIADGKAVPAAYLLDADGTVGHLYGAKTTPHMYVVNKDGTLVYEGAIDDAPSADSKTLANATNYVKAALADLEAGKPVATAQTKAYGCGVKYAH